MDPRLHVVGAEHDDDEIERRMRAKNRWQSASAVPIGLGKIVVKGSGAAVQPFGDDMDIGAKLSLQHARPAIFERMAPRT